MQREGEKVVLAMAGGRQRMVIESVVTTRREFTTMSITRGAKMWELDRGGGVMKNMGIGIIRAMKNMGMAIGIIRSRNQTLMLSWRHSLP